MAIIHRCSVRKRGLHDLCTCHVRIIRVAFHIRNIKVILHRLLRGSLGIHGVADRKLVVLAAEGKIIFRAIGKLQPRRRYDVRFLRIAEVILITDPVASVRILDRSLIGAVKAVRPAQIAGAAGTVSAAGAARAAGAQERTDQLLRIHRGSGPVCRCPGFFRHGHADLVIAVKVSFQLQRADLDLGACIPCAAPHHGRYKKAADGGEIALAKINQGMHRQEVLHVKLRLHMQSDSAKNRRNHLLRHLIHGLPGRSKRIRKDRHQVISRQIRDDLIAFLPVYRNTLRGKGCHPKHLLLILLGDIQRRCRICRGTVHAQAVKR